MCYCVTPELRMTYRNQESQTWWRLWKNARESNPHFFVINMLESRLCKLYNPYYTNTAWAASGPLPREKGAELKLPMTSSQEPRSTYLAQNQLQISDPSSIIPTCIFFQRMWENINYISDDFTHNCSLADSLENYENGPNSFATCLPVCPNLTRG
jgi:hypothetical protein